MTNQRLLHDTLYITHRYLSVHQRGTTAHWRQYRLRPLPWLTLSSSRANSYAKRSDQTLGVQFPFFNSLSASKRPVTTLFYIAIAFSLLS